MTILTSASFEIDNEIESYHDLDRSLPTDRDFEEGPGKPRILIVDDSPTVRAVIRKSLKDRYECSEADTILEAFDQLRSVEYAVVIAGIIPGLLGIELLRKVIEEYPNVAVIMVSSFDRPQPALDSMRLGAFEYIIKPVLHRIEPSIENPEIVFVPDPLPGFDSCLQTAIRPN